MGDSNGELTTTVPSADAQTTTSVDVDVLIENKYDEDQPESKRLQGKYAKLKTTQTTSPITVVPTEPQTTAAPVAILSTSTEPVSTPSSSPTEPVEGQPRPLGLRAPSSGGSVRSPGRGTGTGRGKQGPLTRVRGGHSQKVEDIKNPDCLLVEDVRVSQKIAQMALKRARHTVDVAASGEEAVDKFKKHHKSLKLILMDIMLPKMSGVEATKLIREFESKQTTPTGTAKRTIILGLTGNVSEVDLKRYKEADMDGCIAKGELLANAVKEALDQLQLKPGEFVVMTEVGSSGPSHG